VHPIEKLGWSICADPMSPDERRERVAVLRGLRDGLRERGETRLLCHVQMSLCVHEMFRGDPIAARPLLDEALALADPDTDRLQFLSVLQMEGTYWIHVGEPARAVEASVMLIRASDRPGGRRSFRIKSRLNLAYALGCLGEFDGGRRYWLEATALAEESGETRRLGEAAAVGLILFVDADDLDTAAALYEDSAHLLDADIDARATALFRMAEAALALHAGQLARAEALATDLIDADLAGSSDDRVFVFTLLTRIALARDDAPSALGWSDRARDAAATASHGLRVAQSAAVRARVLHQLGRVDEMFDTVDVACRGWGKSSGRLLWQTFEARLAELHQLKEVELRATNEALRRLHQQEAAARARAEAAARSRHLFLSAMSHEMRTPLTGVLGALSLIDQGVSPREHDRLLGVARRSAGLTLQIIDDILDLGRLESGRMSLDPGPFQLRRPFKDVVSITEQQARTAAVDLSLSFAPHLPVWVRGDARRLKQVLLNLVSNALKFAAGGRVHVRVAPVAHVQPTTIRVEVDDNGIGIPDAVQDKLFEPFTQAGPAISRGFGGTGLGLSICRAIVRAFGGRIGVDSTPGVGALFWFEVPMVAIDQQHEPTDDEPSAPPAPNLDGLRILLAEDNAVNRQLGAMTLEMMGARVSVAVDGVVAIQMVQEDPPDVILMDMHMPRMGGLTATRHLRATGFDGPVVALTAAVLPEDRDAALAAGMDGFATKPIDADALLEAIQDALRARRPTP